MVRLEGDAVGSAEGIGKLFAGLFRVLGQGEAGEFEATVIGG